MVFVLYQKRDLEVKASLSNFADCEKKIFQFIATPPTSAFLAYRHHYYVDVVLRGYRTGKPLETLQSYREAKINLRSNTTLAPISELFKGKEREKFLDYISEQNTNANTYGLLM